MTVVVQSYLWEVVSQFGQSSSAGGIEERRCNEEGSPRMIGIRRLQLDSATSTLYDQSLFQHKRLSRHRSDSNYKLCRNER